MNLQYEMEHLEERYFIDFLASIAHLSTCERRATSALVVKGSTILTTGANRPPYGSPTCTSKGGCLRQRLNIPSGQRDELCCAVHAEQEVILNCARYGLDCDGATVYCTNKPCTICTKLIINAGISRVVYLFDYDAGKIADDFVKNSNCVFEHYLGELPVFTTNTY